MYETGNRNEIKFKSFLNKNRCNGKKVREGSKYAITTWNIKNNKERHGE